jgi:5-methylcytosine-specific restriction endonuclease McrA
MAGGLATSPQKGLSVALSGKSVETTNIPVLVLNQDYQPINICRVRRALVLVLQGKAEVVENGLGTIHAISCSLPIPSVVRLAYSVKRPRFQRKLTRFEVFNRDRHTCQYCRRETKELTLDHVIPRSRGGQHSWENVVSCCFSCNRRKAGRTPAEAGMKLIRNPAPPPPTSFCVPYQYLRIYREWHKFLPEAG